MRLVCVRPTAARAQLSRGGRGDYHALPSRTERGRYQQCASAFHAVTGIVCAIVCRGLALLGAGAQPRSSTPVRTASTCATSRTRRTSRRPSSGPRSPTSASGGIPSTPTPAMRATSRSSRSCAAASARSSACTPASSTRRVIYAQPAKTLRLNGALGPLQEFGVTGSMTWQIEPAGGGSRITLTYNVGGFADRPLADWAPHRRRSARRTAAAPRALRHAGQSRAAASRSRRTRRHALTRNCARTRIAAISATVQRRGTGAPCHTCAFAALLDRRCRGAARDCLSDRADDAARRRRRRSQADDAGVRGGDREGRAGGVSPGAAEGARAGRAEHRSADVTSACRAITQRLIPQTAHVPSRRAAVELGSERADLRRRERVLHARRQDHGLHGPDRAAATRPTRSSRR